MMKHWKKFGSTALILFALFLSVPRTIQATTYYVSYTQGHDSNNGTSKATPWQHAPGMSGCAANCNITPQPGDNIIFEGCVTWPNSAFTWNPPGTGSAGNPVYYGVDKTWWDSSVSGCGSAWNRPIFNLGNAPPTDNLYRIINLSRGYQTFDGFEITDVAALASPGNGSTTIWAWGDPGNTIVENMYIHGWVNPCFTVGTGNLTNGSSTVTNYVPYNYSPSPTTNWGASGACQAVLLQSLSGGIPIGNNTPRVTSVSGSNPYTVSFTNTAGGATQNCTGCVIQIGNDLLDVTGGIEGPTNNDVFQNNVVDGSDTAEVQMNPYGDCGLSEGNNNVCVASGTVGWRVPNIFRDNVIRFVENGMVGECSEFSGNLIEYVRLSTNPTAHTNFVECLNDNPVNGATLFYNNVIRHGTNPNPNSPPGRWAVGVGAVWFAPVSGETAYFFNNVFYDVLQNAVFERASSVGSVIAFNNSVDCGPSWSLTTFCVNPTQSGDIYENNHFVTTSTSPFGGSGYTATTNLIQPPATANGLGYTENETYAYSPSSGAIGTGTNAQSYCASLSSAGLAAAAAACQNDTTYGALYMTSGHTATTGARATTARPTSGAWGIGAYEFGSAAGAAGSAPAQQTQPNPPTALKATVN